MAPSAVLVTLSSIIIGLALVRKFWLRTTTRKLPPSPRSFPLIGHLLSMPNRNEHLGFANIGKQLNSDIFSLNVLGTNIIVLNSLEHSNQLLTKRASIYSDRICPPMVAEPSLMNWGSFLPVEPYSESWKIQRRLTHPWLNKHAIAKFELFQESAVRRLLQNLWRECQDIEDSEQLFEEFYTTISSTLTESVYGHKIENSDDPFHVGAREIMQNLTMAILPSNFLVNVFPFMVRLPNWLPGTEWKQVGRKWGEQKDRIIDMIYSQAKARIALGEDQGSIASSMMEQAQSLETQDGKADIYVKNAAFALVGGGTESTASMLLTFVLAMVLFPGVQKRAQQEIDEVVGIERLPTMDDRPSLGYIERLIDELLRWRPVAPLGLPHACIQDDVYEGFFIPKGAIIFANIWAISHDPSVYKTPEEFNPDRYLDPSMPVSPGFGFGRRSCPGVHLAKAVLFLSITSILAAFKIVHAENHREDIETIEGIANRAVFHPKPFKLRLVPRNNTFNDVLRREFSE